MAKKATSKSESAPSNKKPTENKLSINEADLLAMQNASADLPDLITNNQITAKKKRGRPKKDEDKKKQQYTLTMNPVLYSKIKSIAEDNGVSVSKFIADGMIEYMKNFI